jgi:hypothetical protein
MRGKRGRRQASENSKLKGYELRLEKPETRNPQLGG